MTQEFIVAVRCGEVIHSHRFVVDSREEAEALAEAYLKNDTLVYFKGQTERVRPEVAYIAQITTEAKTRIKFATRTLVRKAKATPKRKTKRKKSHAKP